MPTALSNYLKSETKCKELKNQNMVWQQRKITTSYEKRHKPVGLSKIKTFNGRRITTNLRLEECSIVVQITAVES